MDTEKKNNLKNEFDQKAKRDEEFTDSIICEMRSFSRQNRRRDQKRKNRLWFWLIFVIIIFLLIWYMYSIGIFNKLIN